MTIRDRQLDTVTTGYCCFACYVYALFAWYGQYSPNQTPWYSLNATFHRARKLQLTDNDYTIRHLTKQADTRLFNSPDSRNGRSSSSFYHYSDRIFTISANEAIPLSSPPSVTPRVRVRS